MSDLKQMRENAEAAIASDDYATFMRWRRNHCDPKRILALIACAEALEAWGSILPPNGDLYWHHREKAIAALAQLEAAP